MTIKPTKKDNWAIKAHRPKIIRGKCGFCGRENAGLCKHGNCSICGCRHYCWLD